LKVGDLLRHLQKAGNIGDVEKFENGAAVYTMIVIEVDKPDVIYKVIMVEEKE